MSTTVTGGKRPFSATGGKAECPALREGGGKGIGILDTTREEGSGMGERECLPDAYCSSCAADIMAKARNPLYSADDRRNSPDGAT